MSNKRVLEANNLVALKCKLDIIEREITVAVPTGVSARSADGLDTAKPFVQCSSPCAGTKFSKDLRGVKHVDVGGPAKGRVVVYRRCEDAMTCFGQITRIAIDCWDNNVGNY